MSCIFFRYVYQLESGQLVPKSSSWSETRVPPQGAPGMSSDFQFTICIRDLHQAFTDIKRDLTMKQKILGPFGIFGNAHNSEGIIVITILFVL